MSRSDVLSLLLLAREGTSTPFGEIEGWTLGIPSASDMTGGLRARFCNFFLGAFFDDSIEQVA